MADGDARFELERAITGNELVLHYQPRVLLSDLELRGVEALVRWRHPTRGIVPPAELIAAAATGGLLRDLDAWVIREALLQAAVWRRDAMSLDVSVNVAPSLLRDEPFLRSFERTLTIQGDPGALTIEVAAPSLGGGEHPIAGLTRLRERGVKLALDDVTALSELEDASWMSWDVVKLGRAVVTRAARDDVAGATVRALTTRATALRARVVGVGVEDDETIALLHDAGGEMVQGYRIARPLGVKELAAWVAARPQPA